MDREYARPLDVEVLARTACMSSGHFSRSFRAAYGETLSAYRARDHAWMESMPACLMRVALRPVRNREATPTGKQVGSPPWMWNCRIATSRSTITTRRSRSIATRWASGCATTSAPTACAGSPSGRPRSPTSTIVLEPPAADPGISPSNRAAIGDLLATGLLRGLNVSTPDLDGTFDQVQAAGAEVVHEPMDQSHGRDCAFRDPVEI